jgi:putative tricarboxylic transport membrane protein
MLTSLFMASCYGGSISSITLGIPGTPAAVATVFDGSAIAKKGTPGKALGYSLYASTVGGLFGCLVLMFLTGPLARLAIRLADPELLLIGLIGLISVASLGEDDPWKCIISLLLGLMVGVIGLDFYTGSTRYTFGNIYLGDGVSLIALLSGFYAINEILEMCMGDMSVSYVTDPKNLKCTLSWKEFKDIIPASLRAALVGVVFGIIPGLGGGPATFFSYTQAKRADREPETFGQGNPRGLAACEAANNAVVGGGLVPLLSLGIPGTPTIAIIAGALMMHGITPGPYLMRDNTHLVYTVYWGLLFATISMFFIGRYTTSFFARILIFPNYVLIPIIIILLIIGAYAGRFFHIDVWTAMAAGLLGFFMKRFNFSLSAFTLAYVLANLIELRFRRSMMLSRGSFMIFFNRPFCWVLWILVAYMVYISVKNARHSTAAK